MIDGFAFSEVVRKLANLIRIGKIAEIDRSNVKVRIGRVTTGWLPIISMAGESVCWPPLSVGEQVAVFLPYGESTQGFVLRSIHYNNFPAPQDLHKISVNAKSDVQVEGTGRCDVALQDGVAITVGNASLKITGSKISINCGASSIDISEDAITINSGSITTNPPVCKCTGGL